MKSPTRSIFVPLACLFGFALFLGWLCLFWQPAQADPAVLYAAPGAVGGDCSAWEQACTLQTALASADSGDQIWVKAGLHKPGASRSDAFALKPGVEMYGGFDGTEDELDQRDWQLNPTVLSGDIDNNDITDPTGVVTVSTKIVGDNSYHVVTASSGITASARLDGFVITAGLANGSPPDHRGGGVYNLAGDPTFANTRLSGNLAASYGGGMYNEGIYGNGSNPSLSELTFSGNSASSGGGLANYYFSSPTLNHVTFYNNSATNDGGGMYNRQDANPSLTDCLFHDNTAAAGGGLFNDIWADPNLKRVIFAHNTASSGGGMVSFNSAHPALDNVTFQDNTAVNGGGMWTYYNAHSYTFKNTRFIGNSAANGGGLYSQALPYEPHVIINAVFLENTASNHGGAIYSHSSQVILTNVTLHDNSADVRAGAFYNTNSSSSTMSNVVLWDNNAPADPEIYNDNTSSNQISYSLAAGSGGSGSGWNSALGTDGGGNLDSDPGFLDAGGGDLHPGFNSPAIDAGNNTAVPTVVASDLDGYSRFVDIPWVADTGNGTAPIVDMGAYEVGLPDVSLEKRVYPATVAPGQAITFTLALANSGALSAAQVALTDTLPVYLIDRAVTWSGLLITDTGHSPAYVWRVQDIEPGTGGLITITGVLSTPLPADVYTNSVQVAFDAGLSRLSQTEEVTYTVSNLAPTFTSAPVTTAAQGLTYTYQIATDDWNGGAPAITAPALPGWLTLTDHDDGTATLSGAPTGANVGDHPVSLLVADSGGLSASQSFTITVSGRIYLPMLMKSSP